jgi:hypothetical protein
VKQFSQIEAVHSEKSRIAEITTTQMYLLLTKISVLKPLAPTSREAKPIIHPPRSAMSSGSGSAPVSSQTLDPKNKVKQQRTEAV